MDENKQTYSWGEFYETTKSCDGYTDEQRKRFIVFETLDQAIHVEEIKNIIQFLTQDQINWLNSPCLDGIIFSIENLNEKLLEKEFVETFKYYLSKNLVNLHVFELAEKGFTESIKLLLDEKVKLSATRIDIFDNYALRIACKNGHTETARLLLNRGADIHALANQSLQWAAENGHIETVRLLLDRGAIIFKYTMCIACKNGHIEIVKLLLDKGADANSYDYIGEIGDPTKYAISIASENGHTEIVKLLLDKGANIHIYDDISLIWASENGHTKTVKLLLDRGCDIHAISDRSLLLACKYGHTETVKLLLDRGANIGSNIWRACMNGHIEIVKLLLDKGEDINENNQRPVYLASNGGHTAILKLILDRKLF